MIILYNVQMGNETAGVYRYLSSHSTNTREIYVFAWQHLIILWFIFPNLTSDKITGGKLFDDILYHQINKWNVLLCKQQYMYRK